MKKSRDYTPEEIEFLRVGCLAMNVRDLTQAFNKRFGTAKPDTAINAALKNHHILCGRKPKERLISRRLRIYTDEQAQFIRDNYAGRSVAEMTVLFNGRFGTKMTQKQIKSFVHNRGITSGRTGYFPKGHRPWNYGTKGQGLTGSNTGSFKKGNVPANRKPIWSERVCPKDGFILMKVPEPDPYTGFQTRYRHKHVYIWEQTHGPVPDGMVVAFVDGNKTNCHPENLMLISRAELLNLNRHGYKDSPDQLKPHILALSKLQVKTWAIENNRLGKQ